MSNKIVLAVSAVCIVILFFAGIIINTIRTKKGKLANETDIISKLYDKQKLKLSAHKSVMKPSTFTILTISCPVLIGIAMYLIIHNVIISIVVAVLGIKIPELIVKMLEGKNAQKWDDRFAKTLTQMAASLRAGLTIPQAIEEICMSPFIHESIKEEFTIMNAGIKLNKTLGQVFTEFADRTGNSDVRDLAAAIRLQEKIGGSEAEVVATISKNITDRIIERKKISSKLAETNMTVMVFDILPIGMIIFMFIAAKDFMSFYFEKPANFLMLLAILAFILVGSIVTRLMFSSGRKVK